MEIQAGNGTLPLKLLDLKIEVVGNGQEANVIKTFTDTYGANDNTLKIDLSQYAGAD